MQQCSCCMWFVELHSLHIALCDLEIAHSQLATSWPDPNLNSDYSYSNPNPNQVARHSYKLCSSTECTQYSYYMCRYAACSLWLCTICIMRCTIWLVSLVKIKVMVQLGLMSGSELGLPFGLVSGLGQKFPDWACTILKLRSTLYKLCWLTNCTKPIQQNVI